MSSSSYHFLAASPLLTLQDPAIKSIYDGVSSHLILVLKDPEAPIYFVETKALLSKSLESPLELKDLPLIPMESQVFKEQLKTALSYENEIYRLEGQGLWQRCKICVQDYQFSKRWVIEVPAYREGLNLRARVVAFF